MPISCQYRATSLMLPADATRHRYHYAGYFALFMPYAAPCYDMLPAMFADIVSAALISCR